MAEIAPSFDGGCEMISAEKVQKIKAEIDKMTDDEVARAVAVMEFRLVRVDVVEEALRCMLATFLQTLAEMQGGVPDDALDDAADELKALFEGLRAYLRRRPH